MSLQSKESAEGAAVGFHLKEEPNDKLVKHVWPSKFQRKTLYRNSNQSTDGKQMATRSRDVYIPNLIEMKFIIHCNKFSLGR